MAWSAPITEIDTGPTKITVPSAVTTSLNWLANVQSVPYFTIPDQFTISSEIATTSSSYLVNKTSKKLGVFIGGRIGMEGQYPNFALFQRTVPYIFSETIFEVDSIGKSSTQRVRLSVDKIWTRGSAESGTRFFNEIRIFRRDYLEPGAPFKLEQSYIFTENPGQLANFILSLPLPTWPGLEPQATIPNP